MRKLYQRSTINRLSRFWALLFALSAWVPVFAQQLPISNAGFESAELNSNSATGWSFNAGGRSTFTIVNDRYRGAQALAVTIDSLSGNSYGIEAAANAVAVEPNTLYEYSIWAKASVDSARINFTVGNPSFQEAGRTNYYFDGTGWQNIRFIFNSGNNDMLRFPIHFSDAANANRLPVTFTVDALQITRLTIQNSGFERDTLGTSNAANWSLGAGGTSSFSIVQDAYEGTRALAVTVEALGANPWNIEAAYSAIPVKPNTNYEYTIWAKSTVDSAYVHFTVGEPAPTYSERGRRQVYLNDDGWQQIRFVFNSATSEMLRFPIHFSHSGNTTRLPMTVTVDAFSIRELPPVLNNNGGFEADTLNATSVIGWSLNPGGNVMKIVDDAREGTKALRVEVTTLGGNPWNIEAAANAIPVKPFTDYVYSIWAKSSVDSGYVHFTVGEPAPTYSERGRRQVYLGTEWQEIRFEFYTGPSDTLRFPIHFSHSDNSTRLPVNFTVDNLQITPVEIPNEVERLEVVSSSGMNSIDQFKGSLPMRVLYTPENALNREVTWSVKNGIDTNGSGKATIDANGVLTAEENGNGTVRVIAILNSNSEIGDSLDIEITNQVYVPVTSVTVTSDNDTTEIKEFGGKLLLVATVAPTDASVPGVVWSIDEANSTGKAQILQNGELIAQPEGDGVVKVVATSVDNAEISGSIEITISGQSTSGQEIIVAWETFGETQFDSGTGPHAANPPHDGHQGHWKDTDPELQASFSSMNGSAANNFIINGEFKSGYSIRINGYVDEGPEPGPAWPGASGNQKLMLHPVDGENSVASSYDSLIWSNINIAGFKDLKVQFGYMKQIRTNIDAANLHLIVLVRADGGDWVLLDTAQLVRNAVGDVWNHSTLLIDDVAPGFSGEKMDILMAVDTINRIGLDDLIVLGTGSNVPVTGITVTAADGAALTITENDGTLQMVANIEPADALVKTVEWSVDDTSIATISGAGVLTADNDGTVTVTATATDGSGVSGSAQVVISGQIIYVTALSIASATGINAIVANGGTLQMSATFEPENATIKDLTWNTNNAEIATVSNTGLVTAVGNGIVRISATTTDGSDITSNEVQISISNQTGGALSVGVQSGITVFPNPAQNFIEVRTSQWQVDRAEVVTLDGKTLLNSRLESNRIDVSGLAQGTYVLRLFQGSSLVASEQIIKQ